MGSSQRGGAGMLSLAGRWRNAPDRRPRRSRGYGEDRPVVNGGSAVLSPSPQRGEGRGEGAGDGPLRQIFLRPSGRKPPHLAPDGAILSPSGRGKELPTRRALLASALALAIARPGHAAAPGDRRRILALGDSLTAGYGLAPDEAFPARLQAKLAGLRIPVEVINAGVSGDTTAGGLARLDWALADHPGYAIVELGANDMLRGLDPQQAKANLDRILTKLAAAQVKVLLAGMQSLGNWGRDYAAEFAAIYPALAEKHHVALYPFFLEGVALDPGLTQPDGLHPNAKGVEVIVDRITPYVVRLLGAEARAE